MAPNADDPTGLATLGIKPGDKVRFRKQETEYWSHGVVVCRERDGSIRLRDGKGAARTILISRIEVQTTGPRGAITWEPLGEFAAKAEQLRLI